MTLSLKTSIRAGLIPITGDVTRHDVTADGMHVSGGRERVDGGGVRSWGEVRGPGAGDTHRV